MIAFLSPWILGVAALAAAATVVLHLLSVRRPPVYELPTARFVAERDVRAVSRSARPSDLLLLLLRVLALLAAGAALAGPRITTSRSNLAHIMVADPSWRADSAAMLRTAGIDTVRGPNVSYVWTDSVHGMRAELGAAWPHVWRVAGTLLREQPSLDSVSVHVFAPAATASADGWGAWRAMWPGSVSVHQKMRTDSMPHRVVQVIERDARDDDVVRAAVALREAGGTTEQREGGASRPDTPVDSVRVEWPASGIPSGWTPARDSVGALVVGGHAMVTPWIRTARAPDGLRDAIIGRWSDGAPAIVERQAAGGCTRAVAVNVPNGSDVLNTPAADPLMHALAAPCGAQPATMYSAILRDSGGPRALASAAVLRAFYPRSAGVAPPWLPSALLGIALLLLLCEQWLRRGAAFDARAEAAAMERPTHAKRSAA